MTWETAASSGVTYSQWLVHEVVSDQLGHRDEEEGSAGVREPRRPRPSLDSGGIALDVPPPQEAFDLGRELAARYGW